jgi:hypothetical protein
VCLYFQAVGNALYGIQGMSSDNAEVRAMLSALVSKVESCREALSAQEMGNTLYGIQGMSSDSAEVRAMLSALVPKVETCREALSAQEMSNALYGIQGMSSDSAEVRAMLSALASKVESCREALSAQAVSNTLYGMQVMSSKHAEHLTLLEFLHDKTKSIAGDPLLCGLLSCVDLVYFGQHLAITLPKLRLMLMDKCNEWEEINSMITDELSKCKNDLDLFFRWGGSQSDAEQRVHAIIKSALRTSISITSNEHLFNLFESDIVLRVPLMCGFSFPIEQKRLNHQY